MAPKIKTSPGKASAAKTKGAPIQQTLPIKKPLATARLVSSPNSLSSCSIAFQLKQLAFNLFDLIQLGEILPHFDSKTKITAISHHDVHYHSDSLLISRFNEFDKQYENMRSELGGLEDLAIQQVRGSFYSTYKGIINGPSVADTIVTAENISEVKVLLLNSFFTL